jgi:hypothetical protein
MAGENGIWLLYKKTFDQEKGEQSQLVGRFVIHGGHLSVLEDHGGVVEGIFPGGPVTGQELRRMQSIENGQSAYWDLVREDDLNEGKRADLVPELDLGSGEWPAGE